MSRLSHLLGRSYGFRDYLSTRCAEREKRFMKLDNNQPLIYLLSGLCAVTLLAFVIEATQYLAFPGFPYEGPWQGLHVIAAAEGYAIRNIT